MVGGPANGWMFADDGTIVADIRCAKCGHRLSGIHRSMSCPECELPIIHSTGSSRLTTADPQWTRKLAAGAGLLLAPAITEVLLWLAAVIFLGFVAMDPSIRMPAAEWAAYAATPGVCVLILYWAVGMWLLTTPEPRVVEKPLTARRATRIITPITAGVIIFGLIAWEGAIWLWPGWLHLLAMELIVAFVIAGCMAVAQYARRLSDDSLELEFLALGGLYALGGGVAALINLAVAINVPFLADGILKFYFDVDGVRLTSWVIMLVAAMILRLIAILFIGQMRIALSDAAEKGYSHSPWHEGPPPTPRKKASTKKKKARRRKRRGKRGRSESAYEEPVEYKPVAPPPAREPEAKPEPEEDPFPTVKPR